MSNQPNIKYFVHDGGTNPEPSGESNASLAAIFAGVDRSEPHCASAAELAATITEAREAAVKRMSDSGAKHAIYAVRYYDTEIGGDETVDIFNPAVLADEAEFVEQTNALVQDNLGCYILAIHAARQLHV